MAARSRSSVSAVAEEPPPTTPPDETPELPPEPPLLGEQAAVSLPAAIDARLIPPFGKTPTAINQIVANAPGIITTQFTGPVVSGQINMGTVPGLALLALPILVDYSMGDFSLPIQFPPQSMLLWAATMVYNSFTGSSGPTDTTFELGTAAGRNDILTADGMGPIHTTAIHPIQGTLPFAIDPNPFQAWLSVAQSGNTAGSGLIVLIFARLGQLKWS
jgi:hypothetical protein